MRTLLALMTVAAMVAAACDGVPSEPTGVLSIQKAAPNSGDGQTDTVLATLSPFRVLVLRGDAPARGVTVSWRTLGGSSSPTITTTTSASGIAEYRQTLGRSAGGYQASASVTGAVGSPVSFTAFATPGNVTTLRIVSGNNQADTLMGRLSADYAVQATDAHGNGVVGIVIDWAVTAGGGSITPTRSTTESPFGNAFARHTLGPDAGAQTVTARLSVLPSAPPVTFTALTLGKLRVTVTTTGGDPDPDGYTVTAHGGTRDTTAAVAANETFTIARVTPGDYVLTLSNLALNCDVASPNPRSVTVPNGGTVDVVFAVTCAAFGSLKITATTTGVDLDPNGYGVSASGAKLGKTGDVAANGSVTIPGLVAGDYSVSLGGVTMNCDLTGPNPRTVTVPSGETAAVAFGVTCAQAAQLAVSLTVNGNTDVYTVKSNGAGLTRLTSHSAYDHGPAWSPDGTKIAFWSNRDGNDEIYVMNQDGSGVTRRTNDPSVDFRPRWSPDGTQIVFVSLRDGNFEIYVMNAGGSSPPQRVTNHPATDADPTWSPDGSKIAFWSDRDPDGEIYVMNPDGSGVTQLTNNEVREIQPEWSPDGNKLAFSRLTGCDYYTGFCDYDIIVMNADGSGAAQLPSGSSDNDAAWSPDGRWIAVGASFCEPYYDYYYSYSCYDSYSAVQLVRTDGTRVIELLRDAFYPAWRP